METYNITRDSSVDMRTLDLYTKSAIINAQLFYLCVSDTVQFSAEALGVEIASSYYDGYLLCQVTRGFSQLLQAILLSGLQQL